MLEPYYSVNYGRVEVDAFAVLTPARMAELVKVARANGIRHIIQWIGEGKFRVVATLNPAGGNNGRS